MSAHRVEHDHGDLDARSSPGNRRRAARTPAPFPTVGALLAFGGPGPRLKLLGADLHFDLPVGEEVAVSAGVARRAAFRGDYDIAVAGFPVVGQIAVRVLHHPTRKVWREFGIGHPSNSLDTPVARWRVDQVFHEQCLMGAAGIWRSRPSMRLVSGSTATVPAAGACALEDAGQLRDRGL